MIDLFEKCYKPGIADEAKARGIYPYFHALESKQDVTVIMEGKRRIMLGSNNYLGLTTNENVIRAGVEAYEAFGSGCSGSRFLNGTLKLHLELEKELAAFLRKDEVVTFSTGFQSNLGIVTMSSWTGRTTRAYMTDADFLTAQCSVTGTAICRIWKRNCKKYRRARDASL